MSLYRASFNFALLCSALLLVGGCRNSAQIFTDQNEGGFFKSANIFSKPEWARPSTGRVSLGPQGPVSPEDLVGADGRCAPSTAATAQEQPPAQAEPAGAREVGSVAGDLAGPAQAPTRATAAADQSLQKLEPTMPQVAGGIALGMTECQTVQRAGVPTNAAISAGDKGEQRRTVLTFLSGPWPGIYTFADGRLKVIDRAPEQPKPSAPAKKTPKKKPGTPKTASQDFNRPYVQ